MSVALTPDQRRAVETRDRDLCVVAGAGTGKTRVLTERVVRRVVDDGVDLARILAITFTEKAAGEMKERLAAALVAAGRDDGREQVESAQVSTIHAFCARLLREHAVEAGVDPGFAVLDEVESERLRRTALERLVEEVAAAQGPDLEQLSRVPATSRQNHTGTPEETLLDLHRAARECPRGIGGFLAVPAGMPGPDALLVELQEQAASLESHVAGASPGGLTRIGAVQAAMAALEHGVSVPAVSALVGAFNLKTTADLKPVLAGIRETGHRILSVLAEQALTPLRDVLVRTLTRLEDIYEEEKGRGERLDFADMERRAVDLLGDGKDGRPSDVRASLHQRFEDVLVDEFQDTNPRQGVLVDLLRPTQAVQGGLFVVGDPKQAIYGFRGSDVGVFVDRMAAVEARDDGGVIRLRHSFRTRPELLGFVNHLFRDGFGGSVPVPAQDLVAGRTFAPPESPPEPPAVEVASFDGDSAGHARRIEADWIARRVVALVEGDPDAGTVPLCVSDPTAEDPHPTRPAGFGDVAVLFRAMTDVKLVEHALTAHGVPYLVLKGRGFFHAQEVVDLAHLLTCVVNPTDDLTLAAVLRAPVCGIDEDALFALTAARRAGREEDRTPLVHVLGRWAAGDLDLPDLPRPADLRLRRFHRLLTALRALRGRASLSRIVDHAFEEGDLMALALARPGGRQRAANLRKVRSMALDADRRGSGLVEFVEELADLREREVRETEAPVSAAAAGAVNLLTVHGAKGLEWPVVFVPDLHRAGQSRRGAFVSHGRVGLGMKESPQVPLPGKLRPWAFEEVDARVKSDEEGENLRLLYVAVTRAAERLVLTAAIPATNRKSGPWWEQVQAALIGAEGHPGVLPPPGPVQVDLGPGAADPDLHPGTPPPRTTVLLHPAVPARITDLPRTPHLLGQVAPDLARGRLPRRDTPEAAEHAARDLMAEIARRVPEPDGVLYATTVSALVMLARDPDEFHRRHVLGIPDTGDLTLTATAHDPDDALGSGGVGTGDPDQAGRGGTDDEWGLELDARARGRAAHLALERLVPEFTFDIRTEVHRALALETGGVEPSPTDVDTITGWIEAFRDSGLGRRIQQLPRPSVRREQPIQFAVGRTVVRGQFDLLFHDEQAGGHVVVDYKSGSFTEPPDDPALQMRLYSLALRAVTGKPAARLVLWSLPRATAVDVPCTAGDHRAVEGGILRGLAR